MKMHIRERSELLKNSLSNFGVEGSSGAIKTGPIITLFEILPAEGVRVNKFVQLSDDIARVMEAQSVRVLLQYLVQTMLVLKFLMSTLKLFI